MIAPGLDVSPLLDQLASVPDRVESALGDASLSLAESLHETRQRQSLAVELARRKRGFTPAARPPIAASPDLTMADKLRDGVAERIEQALA